MTNTLWTITDIAAYLVVSEASADRYRSSAGFPVPIVLPSTGKGERQLKRWIPEKIMAWAESRELAA